MDENSLNVAGLKSNADTAVKTYSTLHSLYCINGDFLDVLLSIICIELPTANIFYLLQILKS